MQIGLFVPTLNAGSSWSRWIAFCLGALPENCRVLVVDSGSQDNTVHLAKQAGFEVIEICCDDFGHGKTRQFGVEILCDCEVIIFLTQDALIASCDSIRNLLRAFTDEQVGMAYGRQLPHNHARPLGRHARMFNYPDHSEVRSVMDIPRLKLKTAFASNSFAAYRRDSLMVVNGFEHVIFGEDTIVAARMLLSGLKVAYCADAVVHHSHDYLCAQEFRRYFDIGVLHSRENWLLKKFGKPEGEGTRFAMSEFRYLLRYAPSLIPSALLRTCIKLIGYRLGVIETYLPRSWKSFLSTNKRYWLTRE